MRQEQVFQKLSFGRAFRFRYQPLLIGEQLQLSRPGLYLWRGGGFIPILEYFLAHDMRKVVYLPWDQGEKEIARRLLQMPETLPPGEVVKQKLLSARESESRLLLFSRPWITPAELGSFLMENSEAALILVDGMSNFIPLGWDSGYEPLLGDLARAAALYNTAILIREEEALLPFLPLFTGVLPSPS